MSVRPYANNERRDLGMEVWTDLTIVGRLKLLVVVPKFVPFRPIWGEDASKFVEREKFIRGGISKYLARDLLRQSPVLLEGFWPSSNWRANHVQASIPTCVDDDPENLVVPPHCGPKNK
jgi:hypothetical protein